MKLLIGVAAEDIRTGQQVTLEDTQVRAARPGEAFIASSTPPPGLKVHDIQSCQLCLHFGSYERQNNPHDQGFWTRLHQRNGINTRVIFAGGERIVYEAV